MRTSCHRALRPGLCVTTLYVLLLAPCALSAAPAEPQIASAESGEENRPQRTLLHSSGVGFPWVNLENGILLAEDAREGEVALQQAAPEVHPKLMAAGDFDGDGWIDLVLLAGDAGTGSFLRVRPGNALQTEPVTMRSAVRTPESLPQPAPFGAGYAIRPPAIDPGLLAVGDFNGDGIDDVVYASRTEPCLYLRAGSRTGLGAAEQRFELPGPPSILFAGEFNRRDGRSDLAAAIEGRPGVVLLFQSELGGLGTEPVKLTVDGEVLDLRMADLDDYFPLDLLIVSDRGMWVLRAPGSPLAPERPVPDLDRVPCDDVIVAAEVGDFVWDRLHRNDLAVVVAPGLVRFLEFDLAERGVPPSSLSSDRFSVQWKVRKTVGLDRFAARNGRGRLHVTKGRLSTVPLDELVLWDDNRPEVQLVFGEPSRWRERQPAANLPAESVLNSPLNIPVDDPGLSVVALHLNADALHDLAILHRDSGRVSMSISAAGATFLVNSSGSARDDDPSDGVCDTDKHVAGIDCTLHAAVDQANATPGMDTIHFSVATVDIGDGVPRATDPLVIDGSGGGAGGRVELTRSVEGGGGPWIEAGGSVIRGLVISGAVDQANPPYFSGNSAIALDDNGGNRVENNYIGTNAAGSQAKVNFNGVGIHDSSDNTIGGSLVSQRNIISGSASIGLEIVGGGSRDNIVRGNLIGTDATGSQAVGNDGVGLAITYTSSGSPEPSYSDRPADNVIEGNVISATRGLDPLFDPTGSTGMGVYLASDGTSFRNNKVGTALDGATPLANATFGVAVGDGSGNSIVENVIAYNQGDGVAVLEYDAGDGRINTGHVLISKNSIHSNGGLGINLTGLADLDGATPNDNLDADSGPNDYLNYPVVALNDDKTEIRLTYDGLPSTQFTFEFFRNASCDPSGYGEGETFLAQQGWFGFDYDIRGTTDANGHFEQSLSLTGIADGVITATATDPDGNTSEFSECPVPEGGIRLSPELVLGMSLCGSQEREIRVTDLATGKEISGDAGIRYEWVKLDGTGLPDDLIFDGLNELKKKYQDLVGEIAQIDVRKSKTPTQSKAYVKFNSSGINVLRAVRENSPGDVERSNYALLIGGMELFQADGLEIEPLALTSPLTNTLSEFLTHRLGKKFPLDAPMLLMPPSAKQCSWVGSLGQNGTVQVKSLTFRLFGEDVATVDIMQAFSALGWIPSAHPLAWLARVISIAAPVAVSELLTYESVLVKSGQSDPFITLGATVPPYLEGSVQARASGVSAVQATFDMTKYCLGKATDVMLVLVIPDLESIEIRADTGQFEDPLAVGLNEERQAETVGMFDFFAGASQPFRIPFDKLGITNSTVVNKIVAHLIPGGEPTPSGVSKTVILPENAARPTGLYRDDDSYFEMRFTWVPDPGEVTIDAMRLQTALPQLVNDWAMEPDPNDIASVGKDTGLLKGLKPGQTDVRADVCIPFTSLTRRSDTNGVVVLQGGAIYVQKYEDLLGDGIKDSNDPGLNGWTIRLESAKDGSIQTQTTAFVDLNGDGSIDQDTETGWAVFDNLEPGVGYTAREIARTGWTQTSANPPMLTVGEKQARIVRIGNFRDMIVEGVKFEDTDGDGTRDPGEPGLSGWTIEVDLNSDGSIEHSTTTGSNGEYRFTNIGLGDLQGDRSFNVREVSHAGWVRTAPLGNTALPMHSGLRAQVDFGNFRFMTVRGKKFHDLNGNGALDSGEPGLPGWEIELDLNRDGAVDRRATTDSSGNFEMLDVGPGDPLGARELSVSEVDQPGWNPTFPASGHIYPIHSGVVLVTDFGNAQGTGICGAKYDDLNGNGIRDAGEPGIDGWTIELTKPDGSTVQEVTETGGGFCFSDLEPGDYTVREGARQGWIRTQPAGSGEYTIRLESGQSRHDVVFGNFREAELCGLKFNDLDGDGLRGSGEPGLPGWTMRLTKPGGGSVTKQTGAGGSYCFAQLGPGSHTIREVQQTGWVQTYPSSAGGHIVSTESGKRTEGLDFGNRAAGGEFVPVSICGAKFDDRNGDGVRQNAEPGLAGWTIELLAGTDTLLRSVVTDGSGAYCFGQIGSGTYSIRELQSDGWVRKYPSGTGMHTIVTQSGQNLVGLDFGNFRLGRIRGKKFDDRNGNGIAEASEPGLAGWTIFADLNRDGVLNNPKVAGVCDSSALEPCAKTDASGQYTIGGFDIGVYAVREVQQPGWRQTTADPADASVTTSGALLSGRDFGNVESGPAELLHLYFPFYQAGSGIFTAFALSNYSDGPANVKFTAYTEEGELCPFDENPAVAQLQAGRQLARLGPEIFGGDSATLQLGWVEVVSDNSEIGGFFQFGTSDLEGLDGSVAITEPSSHFYLTRVYEFPGEVSTHISVANPGASTIRVILTYLDSSYPYDPNATVQKTFDIAAKGMLSGSVTALFDGLQGAGCIEVEVEDSNEAVGFALIRQTSPKSLVGLNAVTLDGQSSSYSAQLASTVDVFTSIKLMNTHRTEDRRVDVGAIGQTGEVFDEVYWLFYPEEQFEGFAAGVFGIDFANDPFVGSLRIRSDSPTMVGDVMFGDAHEGKYLAALPLQTRAFRRAVFNHVANGLGFFTGLAFYNPSASAAQIQLSARTPEGELAGEHSFSLEPGCRTSQTVSDLVPASNGQVGGYILIESSIPIIAQQLFGLSNLSLMSAVPPTVIE